MAHSSGRAPLNSPFDNVPNLTGYARPENAERHASTVANLTPEQLAWIFRPLGPDVFEKFHSYVGTCADIFLARAFKSVTYPEFLAYLYSHRAIAKGLENLGGVDE